MESIRATLPTLGEVDITFHTEAHEVLEFFGKSERARLDNVLHLGPAARAFTGLNHSRWEYTLLQCALIQYVSVVFKGHPHVALRGRVKLDGLSSRVSSGEELLKAWALLGNIGHTQWTYGVERGLLRAAYDNTSIKRWFAASTGIADLREWISERIDAYDDSSMHYILVLRRIAYGKPYDRRKTRFAHLLRNLLLPIDSLLPEDPDDRSKLSRLRKLYERIRLLSLVTLDAYNSHKPLRVSLHTTINSFGQIAGLSADTAATDRMLNDVAAWLGDELYLHPAAAAVQLDYEERVEREFPNRFDKSLQSKRGLSHLLANIFRNGFGDPWVGRYVPILRLTFPAPRRHVLGREDLLVSQRQLQADLCATPMTAVAIDRNPFSRSVHLDLLRRREASLESVAAVWTRVTAWLLRAVEADALALFRRVVPVDMRTQESEAIRRRILADRLKAEVSKLESIFRSVLSHLVEPTWSAVTAPFLPSEHRGSEILASVAIGDEIVIDDLRSHVSTQLAMNPDSLEDQRLHEVKGMSRMVARSTAPVLLGCCEPVHLYDGFGMTKDEWDATLLEIDANQVRLHIFEGKSSGGAMKRANQAFKQLAETRDFVCRGGTKYRRQRIPRLGAIMTVYVDAAGSDT